MPASLVDAILNEISRSWRSSNEVEITLEANPTSSEAAKFRDFRSAGVNRLSMGIQALNDPDLKRLGRLHSAAEAIEAFTMAREIFERISFDLIYGRQDQTLREWEDELTKALAMSVDHLSLYQLTIEEGTAFGDRFAAGKLKGLPPDDLSADMYELTQNLTEQHAMPAYEVSNHAKPGSESRHNLIYWTGGDYFGIGPGAHGRFTLGHERYATETELMPTRWLKDVSENRSGEKLREELSSFDIETEYVMMGLRLKEGIEQGRLYHGTVNQGKIEELIDAGFLTRSNGRLCVPQEKRILLNAILRELMA